MDVRHGTGEASARRTGQAGHERRRLRAGVTALPHDRLVLPGGRRQDQGCLSHDELGFLRSPAALGSVDEDLDLRLQPSRLLLAPTLSEVQQPGRSPPVRHDRGRLEPAAVLSADRRPVARGRETMTDMLVSHRTTAVNFRRFNHCPAGPPNFVLRKPSYKPLSEPGLARPTEATAGRPP